jgi:hypothetical protein
MGEPRRTIVVGDVHGCIDELEELVRTVAYTRGRDRLVFLGDLLDRGPDPAGVVRRVRELGGECVLGNHEEKHLRYAAHEARRVTDRRYRNPIRFDHRRSAQHAALRREDLAWLTTLPRVLALGDGWIAVHAGFLPGRPVSKQPTDWMIRLRYVDAEGNPVSRLRGELGEPGVRRWAEVWTGPERVVYGHHPQSLSVPSHDEPIAGVRCVGIDTGCVYGGKLTALVLPAEEIVQVPSRLGANAVPRDEE